MVCQRFLSPFPIIQTFFYRLHLQGDLIFIFTFFSFLPDYEDFLFKKRKKNRAHRWISTCSNAFYLVFNITLQFDKLEVVYLKENY